MQGASTPTSVVWGGYLSLSVRDKVVNPIRLQTLGESL